MKFADLPLRDELLRAVRDAGYETPTPIQEQSIPPLLEGRDLLGIAQTGTGKTAAFVLPLLQHILERKEFPRSKAPRTLILAPTRELAAQIGESIRTYGKHARVTSAVIFGGVGQQPQVDALKRGLDLLVATPGRLLDLLGQGHLSLDRVECFVLDEADRMLDMGFLPDVKRVIAELPKRRHTLFFSATMSPEIDKLAKSLLTSPVHVEVAPQATTVEKIDQEVLFVENDDKDALLLDLVSQDHLTRVLVFTKTKHRANKVAKTLCKHRIPAEAIHGNKSQTARTKALAGFKSGKVPVLVATDIAARGIDVDGISHVINYDLPNEPENYVHRIGRTARAGKDGTAYSFCTEEEKYYLNAVERLTRQRIRAGQHRYHSAAAERSEGRVKPVQQRGRQQPRRPRSAAASGRSRGRRPRRK